MKSIALTSLPSIEWHMENKTTTRSAGLIAALITLLFAFPIDARAGTMLAARIGTGGKCEGSGVCHVKPWTGAADARTVQASGDIKGDAMSISFKAKLPEEGDHYPIDHDIVLDPATSKALGFKTVTILAGDYQLNRSGNKFGTLYVKVRTTKKTDK
jgi:hypothetical protein